MGSVPDARSNVCSRGVRKAGALVVHVVLLIACAVAIYLSCEWFVNAVEWLGQRLNLGSMAVGTVLAAFGTALPESVVTLVAVTTGPTAEVRNIGVGAAMGGPLVLATVAYGVTGTMLLLQRRRRSREKVLVGVWGGAPRCARCDTARHPRLPRRFGGYRSNGAPGPRPAVVYGGLCGQRRTGPGGFRDQTLARVAVLRRLRCLLLARNPQRPTP